MLVGVARHECRGLLLGAHGVAPGKGSLTRRVRRVLDTSLARAPGGRSWVAGFAAGMLVMAAPLAALTFAPAERDKLSDQDVADALAASDKAVDAEVARAADEAIPAEAPALVKSVVRSVDSSNVETQVDGATVLRSPDGATITVHAADAKGRRKLVLRSPNGATMTYADARSVQGMRKFVIAGSPRGPRGDRDTDSAIERAIERKALGVTPDYIDAIVRAAPQIGHLRHEDAVAMRAVGVTPRYVQELAAAGFANLDEDKLIEARAIGVTPEYVRSMSAAGVRASLDDYVEMRALGINAGDVTRARRDHRGPLTARKLVKIKTGDWESYARSIVEHEPPEPPEPPEVEDPDHDPHE